MASRSLVLLRPATSRFTRGEGEDAFDSAQSPFGERFSTYETEHRIGVTRGWVRRFVGCFGTGAGEFRYPRGVAFLHGATREESRLFVCDAGNHRVQVFDGDGSFVFAFGGRGRGNGQFDTPSSVALVSAVLPGEDPFTRSNEPMLAIADTNNYRVQFMSIDGVFLATWDGRGRVPGRPLRLAWDGRTLEVTGSDGSSAEIEPATIMPMSAPEPVETPRHPHHLRLVVGARVR
jgi:hypothetical protein